MDIGINFYELKTQLADIGFHDPDIVAQLREAMFTEFSYEGLYTDRDHTRFQINLDKDQSGIFRFNTYDAILNSGGKVRDQVFGPDVPVLDALALLKSRLQRPDVGIDQSADPMNSQQVRAYLEQSSIQNQLKINIMNTQNLEQLKKSLLNLGFGEKLNDQLEKNITAALPEFTLNAQHEFNQKKLDYTLHFRAGDERYFFNSYDAKILNADPAKEVKQTFKINKGNGVTAKEAFNLMEGRAVEKLVFKDDKSYHAWFQLDQKNFTQSGDKQMKQFHENYGYNVEKVLLGHGIKEMNEVKSTDELLYSLKKGNVQQINVDKDGEEKKYFISANPQFKTVDLFDHQMKKIKREELIGPQQKHEQSTKQSKEQKEDQTEKKQSKRSKKITA